MHIGFLTNCLRQRTLPQVITWAGENGFAALEIAAYLPNPNTLSNLDADHFDSRGAEELGSLAQQHGITLSCLTCCENTLDHNSAKRERIVSYLYRVIDAAQMLGVRTVCTFIGRDETKTQQENFDEMVNVFTPLLDYAGARGIRIAIENCPMLGWQFEGLPGNLAYAPVIWDEMCARLPHANFGLNLDPSHLVWLGLNYYELVPKYAPRIFYAHAKDTQVFADKRDYYSFLNSQHTWWTYRLPGKGEIDWKRWANVLRANGYDGVLSIEHEDPEYEYTEELVKEGLLLGKKNLMEEIS
jgi:sugar phosphate isomerase/epimerase